MDNSTKPTLEESLQLNFNDKNDIWLTNGYTLRSLIGILGMSLPLLLVLFLFFLTGKSQPLESISHYYYTRSGAIFTIIVSLLAIFLIVYKGKERQDFFVSLAAGIFALCVLLFPTSNLAKACCDTDTSYAITFIPGAPNKTRELFHYISAGIFLLCLAYMSLFLFTKSPVPMSQRGRKKKLRNSIYIICGALMVISILFIFIGGFLGAFSPVLYDKYHLTFWGETVAVEAFGFSWLVKGEVILRDEEKNKPLTQP